MDEITEMGEDFFEGVLRAFENGDVRLDSDTFLSGTPGVRSCAEVCETWMQAARFTKVSRAVLFDGARAWITTECRAIGCIPVSQIAPSPGVLKMVPIQIEDETVEKGVGVQWTPNRIVAGLGAGPAFDGPNRERWDVDEWSTTAAIMLGWISILATLRFGDEGGVLIESRNGKLTLHAVSVALDDSEDIVPVDCARSLEAASVGGETQDWSVMVKSRSLAAIVDPKSKSIVKLGLFPSISWVDLGLWFPDGDRWTLAGRRIS